MNNKYATAAEVARGLTFAERFESADEVVRNGGQIVGAVCFDGKSADFDGASAYLEYASEKQPKWGKNGTVFIRARVRSDLGSSGVRLFGTDDSGGSNYETRTYYSPSNRTFGVYFGFSTGVVNPISAFLGNGSNDPFVFNEDFSVAATWEFGGTNTTLKSYRNGEYRAIGTPAGYVVAPDGKTQFGAWNSSFFLDGKIYEVKFFDRVLTVEEIADLHNDATYAYEREASLWLPMGMGEHDPDNLRTLDVSGNGNHAQFGDGATPSTYPTKTRRRGYEFIGNDDYFKFSNAEFLNNDDLTIHFEITPDFDADATVLYYVFDASFTNRHYCRIAGGFGQSLQFVFNGVSVGSVPAANYRNLWQKGDRVPVTISFGSNRSNIWIKGAHVINDFAVSFVPVAPAEFFVGTAYTGGGGMVGTLHSFACWPKALTPIQILDLHYKSLGKGGVI